ncbi:MAG: FAD-binding protein [Planctomycetes bacterium]|nr:FAD-binding protein [Planctomycetota bacterium]
MGYVFDLDENGRPARAREGGRIATTEHSMQAAMPPVRKSSGACQAVRAMCRPSGSLITVFALDLLTTSDSGNGSVVGAITHHPEVWSAGDSAHATIIAMGGSGQAYRRRPNPLVCTGDGVAMAYRAGAALADMAFVQLHLTTLYVAGSGTGVDQQRCVAKGLIWSIGGKTGSWWDAMRWLELAPARRGESLDY